MAAVGHFFDETGQPAGLGTPISLSQAEAALNNLAGQTVTATNDAGTETVSIAPIGVQVTPTEYRNYGISAVATIGGVSLAYAGANDRGFWQAPGYGNTYAHHALRLFDTLDNGTSDGTDGRPANGIHSVSLLYLEHQIGAGVTGVRETLKVNLIWNGASSAHNTNNNYVAVRFNAIVTAGDRGTAGAPRGAFFAMNPVAYALSGATNLFELAGDETNVGAAAGASFNIRYGSSSIGFGQVQGSFADAAFAIGGFASSVPWRDGLLVSDTHGGSPLDPTGSVIRVASLAGTPMIVDRLMDFRGISCASILLAQSTTLQPGGWTMTAPGFAMDLGSTTTAGSPYIDLHSSGNAVDYDGRIMATGGSATAGQGGLSIVAAAGVVFSGPVYPSVDNAISSGKPTARWSTYYGGSGAINTSDQTEKADIADLDAALLDAVDAVEIKQWRFIASVAEKGDAARTHTGVIAQQVWDALSAKGLDPARYSFWCRDGVYEEVDQDATVEVDATTTETYETTEDVDHGDHIVRQVVTRTREVPVIDKVPVLDAAGKPIMLPARGARPALDKDGQPIIDPATGIPLSMPAVPEQQHYVLRPRRVTRTVTTKVDRPKIDPATGQQAYLLGVRPTDLLFAMMLAGRRRADALAATVATLTAQLGALAPREP